MTCRTKSLWSRSHCNKSSITTRYCEFVIIKKKWQGDGGGTCSDRDWSFFILSTRWHCHRNVVQMARKQVFKHSFRLICSCCIYLLSLHDRDVVEAAIAAAGPAELYFFSSHVLNFNGHRHCKVWKFHTAESSSFHFCNSTHLLLKKKYKWNSYKLLCDFFGADFSFPAHPT